MAPIIIAFACIGVMLFALLAFAVFIFMMACRWCGVERPRFPAAAGIVIVSWVVWTIVEAILVAVLQYVYESAGYPLWEARIVSFFLALPLDLTIATGLHMALMRAPLGKAVEVWYIQRLILLAIVLALTAVVAVGFLAAKG